MDERTEKAYSPKEVFTTLDIGDSTLRKWCLALEKNGYGFIRNDQNRRIYVESDLVVLRHFQNLVHKHNMQLDNAAMLVIDRFGKGTFEVSTVSVPEEKKEEQRDLEHSNEDIKELKQLVTTQNELIKELISRMDQQQKYIDERLEQRDKKLMESLRQSQEEKQVLLQIAAAQEEEKKKGFFARLFGK
jgi:Protein of unknown function (DUF3967)